MEVLLMLEQIKQASETEMYVITLKLYSSVSTLSVVNVVSACRDLRTVTDTITCEQTLVHTVVTAACSELISCCFSLVVSASNTFYL